MFTLDELSARWEEKGRHGSPEERVVRSQKWMPYYSYLAKRQREIPYTTDPQAEKTAKTLVELGVLREGDRVLDVGAGTGSYDLELAKYCRQMVALDNNPDCLEVLALRAMRRGQNNIETLCTTWEAYAGEEKFDVTFSAMCPAICNVEELRRLEGMTKRTCCLIAVMRGSYEKHRMAMMKALPVVRSGGMATEALTYVNALYLMGRKPNMLTWSMHTTTETAAEKVLEQYRAYFPIFGVDDKVTTEFLTKYLEKEAPDGVLRDESVMHYALIFWNVP